MIELGGWYCDHRITEYRDVVNMVHVYQHGDNPEARLSIPDLDFRLDPEPGDVLEHDFEIAHVLRIWPGRHSRAILAFVRWVQRIHEYEREEAQA